MIATEPLCDLFGRPLPGAQQGRDLVPQPRPGLHPRLARSPRLVVGAWCLERPVRAAAAAGTELAVDGGSVEAETGSDLHVALTSLDTDEDLFTVFDGQRSRAWRSRSEHPETMLVLPVADRPFVHINERRSLGVSRSRGDRSQRHAHHRPRRLHSSSTYGDISPWSRGRAHYLSPSRLVR